MYYQFKLNGYTTEDLVILNRVVAKLYRRARTVISRVIRFLMGLLMLVMGALFLAADISIPLAITLLVLGVLYLGVALFHYRFGAWRSRRIQLKDAGEITVTLDDAGVRERGQKGESFYPYSSFIACAHCQGRYLLFIDKMHAIILWEEALTVGNPAALGEKLAEKFGGTIREL